MIRIESGNIMMTKDMTSIGEEAIVIRNLDGEDESIMLFEYDWDCLLEAIDEMKKKMGEWKKEEPTW